MRAAAVAVLVLSACAKRLGLPPPDKGFEQQVLRRGYQLDLERGIHQAVFARNADGAKYGIERAAEAAKALGMSDADFQRTLARNGLS